MRKKRTFETTQSSQWYRFKEEHEVVKEAIATSKDFLWDLKCYYIDYPEKATSLAEASCPADLIASLRQEAPEYNIAEGKIVEAGAAKKEEAPVKNASQPEKKGDPVQEFWRQIREYNGQDSHLITAFLKREVQVEGRGCAPADDDLGDDELEHRDVVLVAV